MKTKRKENIKQLMDFWNEIVLENRCESNWNWISTQLNTSRLKTW